MEINADHTTAHNARSPETWAQARDAYLAGAPAPEVCARYGIALSTFRERARREGWRRADQAEPAPFDFEAELDENGLLPGPGPLADDAWMGLLRTLRQDRPREALAWLRLYRALKQQAREEADAAFHAGRGRAAAPRESSGVAPGTLTIEEVNCLGAAELMARLDGPGGMDDIDEATFDACLARMQALGGEGATPTPLDELDDLDSISRTGGSEELDDLDDLDGVSRRPTARDQRLAA